MIQELQDAINMADAMNSQKAKDIFLKIASLPEEKQKPMLELTKLLIKNMSGVKPKEETK